MNRKPPSPPNPPNPRSSPRRGRQRDAQRIDPTKVLNQPALQTSGGTIWVVMAGLFAVAALVPFVALVVSGGPSAGLAGGAAIAVVALYAVLVVLRFAIPRGKIRLRWLAACMLTMAAVSLIGIWVAGLIESS